MTQAQSNIKTGLTLSAALATGLIFRVWDIELRPLHHDEGVNFYFFEILRSKGFYPYSHENFHGPLFFYLNSYLSAWMEDSILGLRSFSILTGAILPLLVYLLLGMKRIGFYCAILCVVSPSLIFHSRYAIHEMAFCVAGAALAISFFYWILTAKSLHLWICIVSFAFLVSLKETFVITCFCILLATIITCPRLLWHRIWNARYQLALSALISLLIIGFIYTAGFQWTAGVRELALSIPQWIGRGTGDVGHVKAWSYYGLILIQSEPWCLLITIIVPMLLYFKRELFREHLNLATYLFWLSLSSLVVYSLIPYKTPWLIINITLPSILLLGTTVSHLFKPIRQIVTVVLVTASIALTVRYTFLIPYGPSNPFSYVHTHQGSIELANEIKQHNSEFPESRILIAVSSWPLPYYLREIKDRVDYVTFEGSKINYENYSIIVLPPRNTPPIETKRRLDLRLSDYHEASVFWRYNKSEKSLEDQY